MAIFIPRIPTNKAEEAIVTTDNQPRRPGWFMICRYISINDTCPKYIPYTRKLDDSTAIPQPQTTHNKPNKPNDRLANPHSMRKKLIHCYGSVVLFMVAAVSLFHPKRCSSDRKKIECLNNERNPHPVTARIVPMDIMVCTLSCCCCCCCSCCCCSFPSKLAVLVIAYVAKNKPENTTRYVDSIIRSVILGSAEHLHNRRLLGILMPPFLVCTTPFCCCWPSSKSPASQPVVVLGSSFSFVESSAIVVFADVSVETLSLLLLLLFDNVILFNVVVVVVVF